MTDDEDLQARLRAATELLELVAEDPSRLETMSEAERIRLVNAAGDVFSPDVEERRRRLKARQRRRRAEKLRRDDDVLAETGIRRLRAKPVFTTPNVFPPEGFAPDDAGGRRRCPAAARPAALLRLQEAVLARPPLLRPALPVVRRVQLRQAHGIGRPARSGRAAHRRAGEDRLPGRHQAPARGSDAHRHHPLPPRRRAPLRPGARLRRLVRPARDLRPRSAVHAERRGLLPAPRRHSRPARLRGEQRVPDGAPPARVLPAHDDGRDRVARADARARARAAAGVRPSYPAAPGASRASRSARCCPARRIRSTTSSPRAASTRTCSRSTCAAGTRGGSCWPRCRPSSSSRPSW